MKATFAIVAFVAITTLGAGALYSAAEPAPKPSDAKLKLRPGARGKLCIECHTDFEDTVKQPFVHTPVKAGDCTSCHSPHASDHGKMLALEAKDTCGTCHQVVPKAAKSAHKPVAESQCMSCHEVHASANKGNLKQPTKELCAKCHAPVVEMARKAKRKHKPVEEGGCTTCHTPHGSATASHLLKEDVPALCVGCHKTDKLTFVKQHMSYPVAGARCTSCHNPHGADSVGMLQNTVHTPVAKHMCSQCHQPATSAKALETKTEGVELCRACHATKVEAMLSRSQVHWPLTAQGGCISCHSPHASVEGKLLKASTQEICGTCHADTLSRHERSPTKHKPVGEGQCTKCHDPHSSDNLMLMSQGNTIEVCGTCHDWQKHSTHPIGPDKKDPRNANMTLQCLSCHRAHGTEYKHLIPFATTSDLCTQCHQQYKR